MRGGIRALDNPAGFAKAPGFAGSAKIGGDMTSPFIFNVASLLRGADAHGAAVYRCVTGPAPERIGVEMLAIAAGSPVTVDATLRSLGSGISVDAHITGILSGECARCLSPLQEELDLEVHQVFAADDSFISGDSDEEADHGSGDEIPAVVDDQIDLLQAVIDEAGLSLPFAPQCADGCDFELNDAPGISAGRSYRDYSTGEDDPEAAQPAIDPRWSGLEKFR